MSSRDLNIDFSAAQTFLEVFSGAKNTEFCFQTFDDSGADRPELIRQFVGTFENHSSILAQLNKAGAGIFFTVNLCDGGGRKKSNVLGVRALFVDKDNGEFSSPLKIEPSAIISAKRGPHAYWFLKDGESLDRFTPAQETLIHHLNSDASIKDLSRVMRLPGFFHMKNPDDPFLVSVKSISAQRYSIDQVMAAYPPKTKTEGATDQNESWSKKYSGDLRTLDLVNLCKESGLYHHEIAAGKYAILCPWRRDHTTGVDGDSSTAIFSSLNKSFPGFHCMHAHCADKKFQHLLDHFGKEAVDRHCQKSFEARKPGRYKKEWPDRLPDAALYGLAGEIVRAIDPHTEADPAAVLLQFLVAFGSVIGRKAFYQVEATRHYPNLFAVIVGDSSKARKGTSWGHILRVFGTADPDWKSNRVMGGLSSGEGLIWAVRDAITKEMEKKDKKTGTTSTEMERIDVGVTDKRLLIIESEFSNVLKQFERDGNNLSSLLRTAWDDGNLKSLVKNSTNQATDAHISMIGHITTSELRRLLTETESANGFGNRLLWACAKRSKLLPEGGQIETVNFAPILKKLTAAIISGQTPLRITKNDEATAMWAEEYARLSAAAPGLVGAVTSRAEAQVVRLSCLYALLDGSFVITANHLKAALALWGYLQQSCEVIFEDAIGDPVADEILRALRNSPAGLTRTQIRDLFNRNVKAGKVQPALELLKRCGLARLELANSEPGGGRPPERWFAIQISETDGGNQ